MRMYLIKQRFKCNLSIRKAAMLLGYDVHHYRRIETGDIKNPSFITLSKIGLLLQIPLKELFDKEVEYLSFQNKNGSTEVL